MSRIVVKGLPPRCSENQLRDMFKNFGTISDCSLKFTKEGKFRRFAFVGFEDGDNGDAAIKQMNESYMGSYKLQVEECAGFGAGTKPRAWSKYAKDSSAYKRKHGDVAPAAPPKKQRKDEEEEEEESTDSQHKKAKRAEEFRNFLDARGVAVEDDKTPVIPKEEAERDEGLINMLLEDIKGDTHLSVLVSGLPSSIKQKHVKDWFAPIRVKALKVVKDDKVAASFVSFEKSGDVKRALLKNTQFLGGYKISVRIVPGSVNPHEEKQKQREEEKSKQGGGLANPGLSREEEEAKVRDAILDTGRLFLRNLPFSTTEADLRAVMKPFGELAEVQVIIAKSTGACKGFAIVEFMFPESAVEAYAKLDGSVFKGRMLHVLPGEEKREEKEEEGDETEGGKRRQEEKSSFKKEKAEKMKKNAAKSQHSWNALFLGANAVADSLAEKLGVSKADILGGEGGGESAAVRLALAETRIVRETRDFLMANGVRLDAFSRPATKRSDTVILAKNLPAGVQQEELQRMFEKFGDLQKVLIPAEGGVSALLVFGNSVDAKAAFSKLAYARFRTQPLYLEWAPGDVFEEEMKEKEEKKEDTEEEQATEAESSKKKRKRGEEMTEEEKKEQRKSKKHKKVQEEEVKEVNEEEEVKEEEKEEAVEEKKEETDEGKNRKDRGDPEENAVVYVKNLSFETDDAALEKLFKERFEIAHGKVSRKYNDASGQWLSMGFGFVQFWTRDDAMEAIKTMQGVLLGGHSLDLKLSNRETVDDGKKKQRKTVDRLEQGESTKLIVRNVPFQASPAEVESLFSSFGGLKSVRMPKKVGGDGSHRGFGFIDFSTKGDAKRAFESLVHSTHLYGRRLVLEWARGEDESVEQLREKTASRFAGGEKEHRKLKKRMEALEKDLKVIDDD